MQVFHRTALVAASLDDDEERGIERCSGPFGQLLRLGQGGKEVIIQPIGGEGGFAAVAGNEDAAQRTVLHRNEFLNKARVLIEQLGEGLRLVHREDYELHALFGLGVELLHVLMQAGVVLGRHAQLGQLIERMQDVGLVQFHFLGNGRCAAHQGEQAVGAFAHGAQLTI